MDEWLSDVDFEESTMSPEEIKQELQHASERHKQHMRHTEERHKQHMKHTDEAHKHNMTLARTSGLFYLPMGGGVMNTAPTPPAPTPPAPPAP